MDRLRRLLRLRGAPPAAPAPRGGTAPGRIAAGSGAGPQPAPDTRAADGRTGDSGKGERVIDAPPSSAPVSPREADAPPRQGSGELPSTLRGYSAQDALDLVDRLNRGAQHPGNAIATVGAALLIFVITSQVVEPQLAQSQFTLVVIVSAALTVAGGALAVVARSSAQTTAGRLLNDPELAAELSHHARVQAGYREAVGPPSGAG